MPAPVVQSFVSSGIKGDVAPTELGDYLAPELQRGRADGARFCDANKLRICGPGINCYPSDAALLPYCARGMPQTIGYIALVVRDYDEALAFYTGTLGFELVEDKPVAPEKRWVLIAPRGRTSPCLLLARAATPEQQSRIGNQTGGRVFLFLHTDDFYRDYHELKARGVRFVRQPMEESYGTVAVFEDLYGNKWDLLQLRNQEQPTPG